MADLGALLTWAYPPVLFANLAAVALSLAALRRPIGRRLASAGASPALASLLFLGGLALRLAHGAPQDPIWSVGWEYKLLAKQLLRDGTYRECVLGSFAECERYALPFHPGGMPALLAGWSSLLGPTAEAARALSVLASALAAPLAYAAALLVWEDRTAAAGAGLVAAVLPWGVGFAGHGDISPVAATWLLATVCAGALAAKEGGRGPGSLAALAGCYAVHLSPEHALLALAALPLVLRRERSIPLAALLLLLPLAPWLLDVQGRYVNDPGTAAFSAGALRAKLPLVASSLLDRGMLGPVPLALAALALAERRGRRTSLLLAALAACYLLVYAAYWTEDVYKYLPVPFTLLGLLAGRGLSAASRWAGDPTGRWALAATAALLAITASYGAYGRLYPELGTRAGLLAASALASRDGYVLTSGCEGVPPLLFERDDVRAVCGIYGFDVLDSRLAERTDVHFLRTWSCDAPGAFYLPSREFFRLACRSIERNFDLGFEGRFGDVLAFRLTPRPPEERYRPTG